MENLVENKEETMRRWKLAALVGAASGLIACAGGGEDPSEDAIDDTIEEIDEATGVDTLEGPGVSGPEPQRVVIEARSFAYQPSRITVAPGDVWFVVTNAADIAHGFEVEGHGMEEAIAEIQPGSTDSLMVTVETPGEYEIYCPVGNHQSQGMTGTLIVGG